MERLTAEQSKLLNNLSSGAVRFNMLSDTDKVICEFLLNLGYADSTTVSKSASSSGVTQIWNEHDIIFITELGKMYLINEQLTVEQELFLENQMQSLRDLADATKLRADTAVADSISARSDARFSKVLAIIAIIISIAAIVVPIALL